MARHERIFGDVVLGFIFGAALWALAGGLYGVALHDDLYLLGHGGVRADMYEAP